MAVKRVFCNVCGRAIEVRNGIMREDVFEAEKEWGYFSNKDTEIHKFNICEACYEEITSQFKIPVKVIKKTEVM
ncbi:hypothetical protein [Anaeromicropila populeti]|uniref:Ribosomal-protein-alanine N-acetyltransferase n=1 Tax=Anaeromicropila populeti TaxID=37658 RepID=A0A1I6J3R8_9FIRM|nr:hypothetical protein [Anaeromicropila populeti]SFR73588.1 ribosomal-protein-alanine N-acetyltransferase [Anaeromicropila populeti]